VNENGTPLSLLRYNNFVHKKFYNIKLILSKLAQCHSAKRYSAKCHSTQCRSAECHSAKCHSAKGHSVKCHSEKGFGTACNTEGMDGSLEKRVVKNEQCLKTKFFTFKMN
jgi:hypothetical protein